MKFVHIADMHFDTSFTTLTNKAGLGDIRALCYLKRCVAQRARAVKEANYVIVLNDIVLVVLPKRGVYINKAKLAEIVFVFGAYLGIFNGCGINHGLFAESHNAERREENGDY